MKSLQKLLANLQPAKGMIYRGQKNASWDLRPSIFRIKPGMKVDYYSHLERFKKYMIGKIDDLQSMSDYEIWALGQHHGLKTPFLDWSVSPAIALYFAFEKNDGECGKSRSLFKLNAARVNEIYCEKIFDLISAITGGSSDSKIWPKYLKGKSIIEWYEKSKKSSKDIDGRVIDMFTNMDKEYARCYSPKDLCTNRIIAQRGLFTYSLNSLCLEDILASKYELGLYEKYEISSSLRIKILEFLDSININDLSLFPDIEGAAKYSNTKMQIVAIDSEFPSNVRPWL